MAKQLKKVRLAGGGARPTKTTYQLGELISVAFEQALAVTKDSREAAELASLVVQRMLVRDGQGRYVAQLASL